MSGKNNSQKIWLVVTWIIIAALLLSGCAQAQTPKVYKVGIINGFEGAVPIGQAFVEEMTKLGYVEGENITYDVQTANFDTAAYRVIIQRFVDDKVDLIFASPTEPLFEAKEITKGTNIPIVFAFGAIEGMGLVDNVSAPGGNMTGVQYPLASLATKRFEVMLQLAPNAKRIWLPHQKDVPIVASQIAAIKPSADAAGVTLIEFEAADAAAIQAELERRAALEDIGIDAIMLTSGPLLTNDDVFPAMLDFALAHKLPFGGTAPVTGELRPVYEVNLNPLESGQLAAPLADKILKGTPAGTIPIVTPAISLTIYYKVAQQLEVTVPEGLLRQADQIIK